MLQSKIMAYFMYGYPTQSKTWISYTISHYSIIQNNSIQKIYEAVLKRDPSPDELSSATQWMKNAQAIRTTGMWDYGYLFNDTLDFKPLPRFAENRWLGNTELPDPELGWLHWNALGGHPELDKAAALKWTAIESGTVTIRGKLNSSGEQGNGVRGRIMRTTGELPVIARPSL